MLNGTVNQDGQALVTSSLQQSIDSVPNQIQAWLDTAFTGDLAMSDSLINQLGLRRAAATWATSADGTTHRIDVFTCFVEWFGERRKVEVAAGRNKTPLLGVSLLLGHRVEIDYRALTVVIA